MGSPMGGWCSPAEVEICSREKEVLDWASVIAVGRSLDLGRQAGRGGSGMEREAVCDWRGEAKAIRGDRCERGRYKYLTLWMV